MDDIENQEDQIENDEYINNLSDSVNIILDSTSSMESLLGGSTSMVNDIRDNLIDTATGKVTPEKLKSYLLSIQNSTGTESSNNGSGINGGNHGNGGRNI